MSILSMIYSVTVLSHGTSGGAVMGKSKAGKSHFARQLQSFGVTTGFLFLGWKDKVSTPCVESKLGLGVLC